MNIPLEKLDQLIMKADQIMVTPEGEAVLLQLIEIQDLVEAAVKEAKDRLEKAALNKDPNFSIIRGDKIKVTYHSYGNKYLIDVAYREDLPAELVTEETKTTLKANTKEIEQWAKKHGGLPQGILAPERPKSIHFNKVKEKEEEHEDSQLN